MTSPVWDPVRTHGVGSEIFQHQLDAYMAIREQLMQRYMQQMAGIGQLPGQSAAMYQGMTPAQQQPITQQSRDEDLVAAATYWGIPEDQARAMPRDALIEIVNRHRTESRPDMSTLEGRIGAMPAMLGAIPSMVPIGVAQGAVGLGLNLQGLLSKLPVIGEAVAEVNHLRDAAFWLKQQEEAVRATTPAEFQWVNTVAETVGNLATLWHPALLTWNLSGKLLQALPLVSRMSPIAKAGFQGGATVYALEGGREDFRDHAGLMLGAGVVLGAGGAKLAPSIERLALRVQARFLHPEMMLGRERVSGRASLTSPAGPASSSLSPEAMLAPESRSAGSIAELERLATEGDDQARVILDYIRGGTAAPIPEVDLAHQRLWSEAQLSTRLAGRNVDDPAEVMAFFDSAEYTRLTDEAENLAAQMNKVSVIVESPAFPAVAGQAEITTASVAQAANATNPGGINIIQGIADPMELVSSLTGKHVQFVQKGTRMDALISDLPLDAAAKQYGEFGAFVGQRARTIDGIEGEIVAIAPDHTATLKPLYSGASRQVRIPDLSVEITSPGSADTGPLWAVFDDYVRQRTAATAGALSGELTPEKLATVRAKNLAHYLDDFLTDVAEINDPADRERVVQFFNQRYVDSFKAAAPTEVAIQESMTAQYARAVEANPLPPVQELDQLAASKGFYAIPDGANGWYFTDVMPRGQRTTMSFPNMDAARTWLRNLHRDLPDVTPASDVPVELQALHWRYPTQGSNTNERTVSSLARALDELAIETEAIPSAGGVLTGRTPGSTVGPAADRFGSASGLSVEAAGGSAAPPLPPEVAKYAADGNVGRLKNLWTNGFLRFMHRRRLFSYIDEGLHEAGLPTGIAADSDELANAVIRDHNDMHPWMDRLTDILKPIRTKLLTDGTWGSMIEMEPSARAAAAAARGMTPREIETFGEWELLMRDLFPNTGLEEIRRIPQYFSHIAQRQSRPDLVGRAFEDFPLGPTTKPFYEYARTGNLNLRELDPRIVGESYIRSVFWEKNMATPFNRVVEKWKALASTQELAPAAQMMENWLKVIRYGYNAEDDLALDTLHAGLRSMLGPAVSRKQAKELFNFGLNLTHSGLLGFRLHVMARDALQLLFAVPRAGADLLSTIARYADDPAFRDSVWRDALEEGAVALRSPRMTAPGSFSTALEEAATAPIAPAQADWRLRTAARVHGIVRDLIPPALRDVRDTPLHPMYFYAKQGELMRALVFTAGKDKTARALARFRSGATDLDGLMGESSARTFDPSWQRQFQELVASGNDDQASRFLGRQLVEATQFNYGLPESPWAAKSLTGRMAFQFGSYSMQYWQYLRESLKNGTVGDKVKFLATAGSVTAGLEAASRETGWNFRWMNPYYGLGFTGGPWFGLITDVGQGATAVIREATTGQQPMPGQVSEAWRALGQAGSFMNPVHGLYRTARGVGTAMESPYPLQALGRLATTGEINNAPDVNQWLQMLQPLPSSVSMTRQGLQGILPQVPSYPPDIQGPVSNAGAQQAPQQVPLPGGQPYSYRPNPASSISAETLHLAIAGDPQAQALFSPVDLSFIQRLGPLPPDVRWQVWMGYQQQQVLMNATRGTLPPTPRGPSTPGGGAQY